MANIGLDKSSKVNESPYSNIVSLEQEGKVRVLEDSGTSVAVAIGDLVLLGGPIASPAKLIQSELVFDGAGTPDLVEIKADASSVSIKPNHSKDPAPEEYFAVGDEYSLDAGSRLALLVDTAETVPNIRFRAKYISNNE